MLLFVKLLNAEHQDHAGGTETPSIESTATTNVPENLETLEPISAESGIVTETMAVPDSAQSVTEETALIESESDVPAPAYAETSTIDVQNPTSIPTDSETLDVIDSDNPIDDAKDNFDLLATSESNTDDDTNGTDRYNPTESVSTKTASFEAEVHAELSETPHDEFDWSIDKRNVTSYPKEIKEKYDRVYENTFIQIEDGEIIDGLVVGVTKTDVVVNIGFKSDGLITLNEFRDNQSIKVGDRVEVMVMEKEDRNGNLNLSRKSAKVLRSWQRIVELSKTGEVVTGYVSSKTKGGLIVDVLGLETFLPGSQIDVKPVTDYDQFVGKTMEFKVVKINENIKNAVVSHKALIESDMEAQRMEIMSKLEKGQVLEGVVKNITDFGAFMDLGGLDGLLYITDISWGRISHPSEVLRIDQKINVVVLDFDDDKKRISLGLKQLTPHPWEVLSETISENSIVKGKVVNIEDYGGFLEVMPGVEGLVHVSEISWANTPVNAKEFFKIGDEHDARVVTLDRDTRKMSLSIKKITSDPWETIEFKYPVYSKHQGTVKNLTPYGVFLELETGIGGMIHISDLSWLKRYNHPSEFTKVAATLEVMIMGIDKDNRKLQLGHKQLEEDPWNTLEETFGVGTKHEGTIIRRDDKGGLVQLPYGLEGFAPYRHLLKEDGKYAAAEENLNFTVIEFDRNDKRILLSHTRVWEQTQYEEKEAAKREARQEAEKTQKDVKQIQQKVEKATLGDLSALADIRAKLEQNENK